MVMESSAEVIVKLKVKLLRMLDMFNRCYKLCSLSHHLSIEDIA